MMFVVVRYNYYLFLVKFSLSIIIFLFVCLFVCFIITCRISTSTEEIVLYQTKLWSNRIAMAEEIKL